METLLHKAHTRGHFDHGWLKTSHTFSFADYYDPERMRFGALRVLNDDRVAPRQGFGLHPHSNMEIVTIPLAGKLTHGDSMGNRQTIAPGEIQVMSAGHGVRHSETNDSRERWAEFLQIWVLPQREGAEPRYASAQISDLLQPGELTPVVVPYPGAGQALWIDQQAWFSLGKLSKGTKRQYKMQSAESYGVYAFLIAGRAQVAGVEMEARDGLGIWETDHFEVESYGDDTYILLIEVPAL